MTTNFRSRSATGLGAGQAADAMWQAMEQLRSSLDKKVGTRMGRGDVRAALLALLAEKPMHGYQMIREIEERTDGRWKPSAGSVYPTLQLLTDEGVVSVETTNDRKTYSLTQAGKEEATEAAANAPWTADASHGSGPFGAVPKAGLDLAQAVAQVVRTGTSEQHDKTVEALNDARRRIYSILAQD
ncbi:PadR family transcriptional regulator [Demequina sp. TTPB684]|uniref:PadR family transcriptional regulator n=1 Tax=unclassified Demequina TaxID=2620311 RepID=UPI001CF3D453|nr:MULTISPECIES: PadR family transcriptional regulator [unclassified Demequina]MCB2413777.1 PadR family transcriptional regulator [Demequina sp. TTPB684]UPU89315.1 PadR family transcriptional regulator [Demequina sp. TMPB413]